MKKILGLLLVVPTIALAQTTEPQQLPTYFTRMPCDSAPKMIRLVADQYKEELLFIGNGMTFEARTGSPVTGGMMFFTNQDTGSFSIIQVFADGIGCMVMNGTSFEPWTGKQFDDYRENP